MIGIFRFIIYILICTNILGLDLFSANEITHKNNDNDHVNETTIEQNNEINNNENLEYTYDSSLSSEENLKKYFDEFNSKYYQVDYDLTPRVNSIGRIGLPGVNSVFATDENAVSIFDNKTHIITIKKQNDKKVRKLLFDKNKFIFFDFEGDYEASDGNTYHLNRFIIEDNDDNYGKEGIKESNGIKYLYDNNGDLVKNDTYELHNGNMYYANEDGEVVENEGIYKIEKIDYEDGVVLKNRTEYTYVSSDGRVKYIDFFKYNDKYYFSDENGYLYRNRFNNTNNYFDINCEYQIEDGFSYIDVREDCVVSYLVNGDDIRVIESEFSDREDFISHHNSLKDKTILINGEEKQYSPHDLDRYVLILSSRYGRLIDYHDYYNSFKEEISIATDNPSLDDIKKFTSEDSGQCKILYGAGSALLYNKNGELISSGILTEDFIDENFYGEVAKEIKEKFMDKEVDFFVIIDESEDKYVFRNKFFIFDNENHKGFNNLNGMFYIGENGRILKNSIIDLLDNFGNHYIYIADKNGVILRNTYLDSDLIDLRFDNKIKEDIINKYSGFYINDNGEVIIDEE